MIINKIKKYIFLIVLILSQFNFSGYTNTSPNSQKSNSEAMWRIPLQVGYLEASLSKNSVIPGECIQIKINHTMSQDIMDFPTVSFEDQTINFLKQKQNEYIGLIAINVKLKEGYHYIQINLPHIIKKLPPPCLEIPIIIEKRKFGVTKLNVDNAKVDISDDDSKRIKHERIMLKKIYNNSPIKPLWDKPFVMPLRGISISVPFGKMRVFNDTKTSRHYGVDLRGDIGVPVYATNKGKVVLAKELFYTGNCIIIDHGYSFFSIYAHLSAFFVKKGDTVETNQKIGAIGETGRVTGPHLHFGIKLNNIYLDPMLINDKMLFEY